MNSNLDVLVLNYNRRDLLLECLPAIVEAAKATCSLSARVVVVDNNSTDGSAEWVKSQWPSVSVVCMTKNDYLFSLNLVAQASQADWLLFLNNDIKPDRDSFELLVQPLLSNETVFSASPCTLRPGRKALDAGKRWGDFRRGLLHHDTRQTESVSPTLFPVGGAFAVSRLRFLQLEGFNSLYSPAYWEDVDLGYGAWVRGYINLYQPTARMVHLGSASWGKHGTQLQTFLHVRNAFLFTWRNVSDAHILRDSLYWAARRNASALMNGATLERRAIADALRRMPQAICRSRMFAHKRIVADSDICILANCDYADEQTKS